jgi:gluconate 2-dehydrogenase alpha chain
MAESLPEEADVCIIGCGGTGSIAAMVLAEAGAKVIALDAGPIWETKDYEPDELTAHGFGNDLGPKWNRSRVRWRDARTGLDTTRVGLDMMNGVGGSTIHYPAHAWRLHPADFRLRSNTVERYGPEALPVGSTVADWPLSYEELEPYYDRVERAIGVSGKAGVLIPPDGGAPIIQPGGNPFEGPRSSEYPMPPLREHRLGRLVARAAERLGYHPFIGPTAINSVDYNSRPATNYCGFCLGYGCRIRAKGSPDVNVLPRALWTGNLEIIPEANIVGLDVDENSRGGRPARLRAVRYVSEGETRETRAKLFMLASYTFENTRLLLHSRSSRFPNGLCNNSGQVGKHFMIHTFDSVAMWFDDQFTNRFGNHGQRICIDDFNADNFDHAGLGFIGGAQIFAPNEGHLIQDLGFTPPGVKFWGVEYKNYVKEYWNRLGFLMTVLEVLPYESNFLELDPERTDEHGVPMIIANFSMQENEERLRAFMFEKMMEIAREAGATRSALHPSVLLPSTHDAGGTRMGPSPENSVVDRWSRAHETSNLFVLGPSAFPTGGGHNPSLTAQALAWRSAEHALTLL